ncbi:MAG: hypothetical protein K1X44_06265 [Alphaproteobacteria bacterium]|nr:hypothetical protein [Alphaproteobacteria bacterium]
MVKLKIDHQTHIIFSTNLEGTLNTVLLIIICPDFIKTPMTDKNDFLCHF